MFGQAAQPSMWRIGGTSTSSPSHASGSDRESGSPDPRPANNSAFGRSALSRTLLLGHVLSDPRDLHPLKSPSSDALPGKMGRDLQPRDACPAQPFWRSSPLSPIYSSSSCDPGTAHTPAIPTSALSGSNASRTAPVLQSREVHAPWPGNRRRNPRPILCLSRRPCNPAGP
jgi:hypothetical protein